MPRPVNKQRLLQAAWPPALAWMRSALRLLLAVVIWAVGFSAAAQIIIVVSVFSLFAAVEKQFCAVALDWLRHKRQPKSNQLLLPF